jgi:hypothetical protein
MTEAAALKIKEANDTLTYRWPSSVLSMLSYVVLAAGAVTLIFSLFVTIRTYSPVWFSDQWDLAGELTNHGGHYPLRLLWAQHNEHRAPIIKILSLADVYVFGGRNVFLFVWNWVSQIAVLGLSTCAIGKLGAFSPWQFRTLVGFFAFCEFNPNQLENFTIAFQSQVLMAFLFSLIAILYLVLYARRSELEPQARHTLLLWICVAAAFLAQCNLASGLIVWVILPLCSLILNLPRALLRLFCVLGFISIALYLAGYQSPPQHSHPSETLRQPFRVLAYIQTYFGASWDNISRDLGLFLSPLAISFLVVAWIRALFRGQDRDRLYTTSIATAGVCLAAATMTALGRLKFGLNQASSSRYQTAAMLFWCFSVVAAVCGSDDSRRYRVGRFAALQLVCLTLFSFQVSAYSSILASYENATFDRNVSGLALQIGADPQRISFLYPSPEPIRWYAFMTARKIMPPPFPEYSYVGASLQSVYEVAPAKMCKGYLDEIDAVPGDYPMMFSVKGWASLDSRLTGKSVIILVTDKNRIAGMGITGRQRPDVVEHGQLPEIELNSGWFGYVRVNPSENTLRAYEELSDRRRVCPLSGELKLKLK